MRRASIKVICAALLGAIIAGVALGCSRSNAKDVAREALLVNAGNSVVDCGWSALDHDRTIQRDCVFDSHRNQKPFIVLYEVAGKEGDPYQLGLAGDGSGNVYMLTIESGDSFPKLYSRFTKSGKRLTPSVCPTPVKLKVSGDGYVICSWK